MKKSLTHKQSSDSPRNFGAEIELIRTEIQRLEAELARTYQDYISHLEAMTEAARSAIPHAAK